MGMKIISINIENQKKIRVFIAKLDGKNLIVSGETGTGKTTAISPLWNILEKGADQVTHGEKKGCISVTLSDGSKTLICSRSYTKSASTINIVDSNGEKLTTKDVDAMLSDLAVNPHKIAEMKPKERVNTLLKSAGIQKELDSLDGMMAQAEEDRLFHHRAKDSKNPGDEPEKAEKVNASDIIAKIEEATAFNKEIENANEKYQQHKRTKEACEEGIPENNQNIQNANDEIKELKEKLKKAIEELNRACKENTEKLAIDISGYEKAIITNKESIESDQKIMDGIKEKYDGVELKDVDGLKEELAGVEKANEGANAFKEWERRNTEYLEACDKHKEADESVKELQGKKKDLLDDVKFPLEGLTIEEGKLYYNECLFENLGTSEQMLVCSALAKEQVGEIRVIRMDGIESMSKGDFEKLKKLFNDADIQILASRVSRGDKEPDEVTIEEGMYQEGGEEDGK